MNGADGKQEYWQFAGAVTAQDPAFNKFTKIGELQPYYSISEIDSLFGNYYPKSELYTQTQVDTKLADKLDTSAEHIYQYLAVQIGQQPGKYVTVLNNMEILADRALRDYNGDTIHATYVKQEKSSTNNSKIVLKP